jgi:hypothetical protein
MHVYTVFPTGTSIRLLKIQSAAAFNEKGNASKEHDGYANHFPLLYTISAAYD